MQLATDPMNRPAVAGHDFSSVPSAQDSKYSQYKIIRRNGSVAAFEPAKISIAMTKAFIAVNGGQGVASARVREVVARLTDDVVKALIRRQPTGGTYHIEDIQDQVELALMRSGEHDGKRVYEITDAGRAQATDRIEEAGGTPWEIAGRSDTRVGEFRNAVRQLLVASKQVSASGNQQQVERMLEILKRARKEIYTMLAED